MASHNSIRVLILTTVLIAIGLMGQSTAQTAPLPLGQVQGVSQMSGCPASFYQGSGSNLTACYGANVSCPSANPIGLTFSYINANTPNTAKGTIVLFNSGGGEMTMMDNNLGTASIYANAGYAVVQTSWAEDWEDTNYGLGMNAPPPAYSILNAACRPATFLNYIANNTQYRAPNTAMCAQGASAGSGAVAYSIVWYGLGAQLNNVELLSGPVFSNIQAGCQVGGSPAPATCAVICQSGACGNGTGPCGNQVCLTGSPTNCSSGTKSEITALGPWSDPLQYLPTYAGAVQLWTGSMGPGSCNNVGGSGMSTSMGESGAWLQQSIVNGTGGVFSWPNNLQGMGGWACYNYQNNGNCNTTSSECPNNSGPEGEQFYIAVNNGGGPPTGYSFTGIQQCNGAEGVSDQNSIDPDNTSWNGQVAIVKHMEANCAIPH